MASCPCGLPQPYALCCKRFHDGATAPTAELLMRSRYSAFAVGDVSYLVRTWHPDTRVDGLHLDPAQRWTGLTVRATTGGGLFDQVGTVAFEARYVVGSRPGQLAENSRFVRLDAAWVYVSA